MGSISEGKSKKTIINSIDGYKILSEHWPPRPQRIKDLKRIPQDERFDKLVFQHSLKIANDYISDNYTSDDPEMRARVLVLQYLIHYAVSEESGQFIVADKIIQDLNLDEYDIKEHNGFMSKVIAKLRDGMVIVASNNHGYKLPTSANDMHEFVNNVQSKILPYLERMISARRILKSVTDNSYDIVNVESFPNLFRLITRE